MIGLVNKSHQKSIGEPLVQRKHGSISKMDPLDADEGHGSKRARREFVIAGKIPFVDVAI